MLRLPDLREILRYVPQYREKRFVIALDGAVIEEENFRNLLLDIALLRSLNIHLVLVHGAGHQIQRLAQQTGVTPSNIDGTGITDAATLQLAINAANRVSHEILEGLSATDLRGACSNSLVAHPAGILQGIDYQHTGRIERVDISLLRSLLASDIIPVIPPLGCDGEGQTWRLNSDAVAVEVACNLQAVKLIYLRAGEAVQVQRGKDQPPELIRQLRVEEAEVLLRQRRGEVTPPACLSKLENAVRACRGGVPRVHIIDGRVEEGLLAEVFSNEGIGTLIYSNEYQAIRPARKRDARAIHNMIKRGFETGELIPRTLAELESLIDDFFVFEVDQTPAACVALHLYPEQCKAEVACMFVDPRFENQGIGSRLLQFLESKAREKGAVELLALSTQAFNYFVHKGGFQVGTPDDLPPARRDKYERSGRRSLVLRKTL